MLDYSFPLWRPPSEGDNLIIQATLGCSFNNCSFCSMYKVKDYVERDLDDIFDDIDRAAVMYPEAHRVFLADGDAYGMPTDQLMEICDYLRSKFRGLQRISAYATPFNLNKKGVDEIRILKEKRLNLVYVGIETGSDWLLKRISKGSRKQMQSGLEVAREAGLKVSATVITGLGGKKHAQEHIEGTIDLINQVPVNYLSTLQLGLAEEVAERFFDRFDEPFEWQDDQGILEEMHLLVSGLNPKAPIIFRSNHASNALPVAGTLPKDQALVLGQIAMGLNGDRQLRPKWMRGL